MSTKNFAPETDDKQTDNTLRMATKLPYIRPKSEDQLTRTQLYSQLLDDDDDDDIFSNFSGDEAESFSDENDDFDLNTISKLVKQTSNKAQKEKEEEHKARNLTPQTQLTREPEVIDDFIRNVLSKYNLTRTLEVFQDEWYEKLQKTDQIELEKVPDVYIQNVKLENEITRLKTKLEEMQSKIKNLLEKLDSVKKERDHHKRSHRRIAQEKNNLIKELNRLKAICEKYDPVIDEVSIAIFVLVLQY